MQFVKHKRGLNIAEICIKAESQISLFGGTNPALPTPGCRLPTPIIALRIGGGIGSN